MLEYTPSKPQTLSMEARLENLPKLQRLIMENSDIGEEDKKKLCLATEEIFANICMYAYGEKIGRVEFLMDTSDGIRMIFEDSGKPFNPLEHEIDIEEYDIDFDIGGLGRYLAFSYVDQIKYEYKDNKNRLMLMKFKEEKQNDN